MQRNRRAKVQQRSLAGQARAGELVYSGRCYFATTLVAGTASAITSLTVITQSSTLINISQSFALYRFEKIRVRIHPMNAGNTTPLGVAFVPGTISTPPTSLINLEAYPSSRIISQTETVCTWLPVSRAQLLDDNSMKFWRTSTTGADAFDATQFTIFLLHAATPTTYLEIFYTVRFAAGGSAAAIPRPIPPPSNSGNSHRLTICPIESAADGCQNNQRTGPPPSSCLSCGRCVEHQ